MKPMVAIVISDALIASLAAITIQLLLWGGQKFIDRRPQKTQIEKSESEIKKIDVDTMAALTSSIEKITSDYIDANEKLAASSKEQLELHSMSQDNRVKISNLELTVSTLKAENADLKGKHGVFESAIFQLQKENFELKQESALQRKMIEYERSEGSKLRSGIDKLINQLRSVPLSPIWEPPTTPVDKN